MEYKISAKAYLERAKSKLNSGLLEDLFYCAFNLRCGIEARMQEYLDPHEHIPKAKKKNWQLGNLSKACEQYFATNQQIQKVVMTAPNGKQNVFYYIPLSKELISCGNKLGNYMHNLKEYKGIESSYWRDFKKLLEETYEKLDFCCKGSLLGAGIVDSSRKVKPTTLKIIIGQEIGSENKKDFAPGSKQVLTVSYHNLDNFKLP